jgi:hypothetical protein
MSFQPLSSRHSVASSAANESPSPRVIAATAPDTRKRPIQLLLVFVVTAILVVILTARVSAQAPYVSIPMPRVLLDKETGEEDEALIKRVQSETKSWVTSGKGNKKMASGYFGAYVPAKMTAPDCVKNINALVEETVTMLSRAHRSNRSQVASDLTGFVYNGMKQVAEGNHHPSARISATLILGGLDEKPANNQTKTPPQPYLNSHRFLKTLYNDENNVDGLRAAALQGIHRQVSYRFKDFPQSDKDSIAADMKKLLASDPPAGRSEAAHAYLQRFAVDILDVLRKKEDSDLGMKLINISTEPTKPDLIALYSASRVGTMGEALKGKVARPEKVLESWSTRALDAFEGELSRLASLERAPSATDQPRKPEDFLEKRVEKRKRSTRMGMGMGMDMEGEGMEDMEDMMDMGDMSEMMGEMDDMEDMGDMMEMGMGYGTSRTQPEAKPQPPEVRASRRKLNHVLQQLHRGVTGALHPGLPTRAAGGLLASVADDENQKAVVVAWVTAMEPVVKALNDTDLDDQEKYVEGLQAQVDILRALVGEEEEAALPADLAEIADKVAPAADELAPAPAPADAPIPPPVDVVSP